MKPTLIKIIYLYLASFIGLTLLVAAANQLIRLGLTHLLHLTPPCPMTPDTPNCTSYTTYENQRQLLTGLTNLLVGLPLYLYHWSRAKNQK